MKHVGDGEQSLMFFGILSSQYSPKGKATAGMGIVGYGDGVGLTIIIDGVYARPLVCLSLGHRSILELLSSIHSL